MCLASVFDHLAKLEMIVGHGDINYEKKIKLFRKRRGYNFCIKVTYIYI